MRTKAQKVNFAKRRLEKVKTTLSDIMREFPEVFTAEMNRKNCYGNDETWIIERILLFKDSLTGINPSRFMGVDFASGKDFSAVVLIEKLKDGTLELKSVVKSKQTDKSQETQMKTSIAL